MQQLTVSASLDSLATIRAYVKAAAEAAGLSSKAAYRLVLAVDEIAANIVTHGFAGVEAGSIEVLAELDAARLVIRIEDSGAEYAMPAPEGVELPLDERQPGGLGLLLARQVDEFHYGREGARNRHTLIMDRASG